MRKIEERSKREGISHGWRLTYSYSFRLDPIANDDRLAEIERRLKKVLIEVLRYLAERRALRAGWHALSNS